MNRLNIPYPKCSEPNGLQVVIFFSDLRMHNEMLEDRDQV